ncbi:S-adenosyl-L-methionine-dependent methyltransferase [Daldinia caldariorum]|uniref:S-adenosyl-L-methionine-dependent methyltransferase n=1 Tax=Daldinia caldariorum TaxID=326644 RepID=UPI002008835C|nr:S-adenosyl-L-methionine-dependent methyltransferase [Daldinia caldariorum]KAI1467550.1 S-adenosyl-L-methionine-dependent methyltransferase [Daldinia caldariorum]
MSPTTIPKDVKERIKASYDAIAQKYNRWTQLHTPLRLEYVEKLFELLSTTPTPGPGPSPVPASQPHFLELGCGAGLPITQKLLLSSPYPEARVTANDISGTQIELARSNLLLGVTEGGGDADADAGTSERLTLVEGDMTELVFPAASFDAVLALYSLIHLPRAEQTDMLGKIARWLKPGGYLVANFAERGEEAIVKEKWLGENDWMFWSGWGKDETLKIIAESGLEAVVSDVRTDVVDASFLWVIARR